MSAQAREPMQRCLFIIIPALCGLLSKLLVPVIEWFLSHRSVSKKRTKRIDALLNRIELVEKLRSIQESSSDSLRIRDIVQFCWDDILRGFESLMPIETRWPLVPGEGLRRWRRFLLLYKQPSLKGKVHTVFFHVFLFVAPVVGTVCLIYPVENSSKYEWVYPVSGVVFYLVLALLFRAVAVHTYKKVAENLAARKSDTSA